MKKLEGIVLSFCVVYAVIFLVFPSALGAQNLNGIWEGECKKHESNSLSFEMSMDIFQDKNGEVEGSCKIAYRKEPWHCEKSFGGKVAKNKFYFQDTKFRVHKHDRGAYWLMLKGTLTYDAEKDELSGWVDAYDLNTSDYFKQHDYIKLRRKKAQYVLN